MLIKRSKEILLSLCVLALVLFGIVLAGEINNALAPGSTNYTLEDIYNKLTDSGYVYSDHTLYPVVTTSSETMYSLEDIFTAVPTYQELSNSTSIIEAGIYATTTLSDIETNLLPENIATGTVMFGVTGTYECTP